MDACSRHWLSHAYLSRELERNRSRLGQSASPQFTEIASGLGELGQRIASLLDTESSIKGVTIGDLRSELKLLAVPSREGGGSLKESEMAVTAGWGTCRKRRCQYAWTG